MRVLFVTIAERSHLYCMTPLAWALRTAGHEVRVAGNPSMSALITGAGLTAVPLGEDLGRAEVMAAIQAENRESQELESRNWSETDPAKLTWEHLLDLYGPYAWAGLGGYNNAIVGELVEYARSWQPDLVVWDPLACSGAIAAKAIGAAHVRSLWSADVWCAMRPTFLRTMAEQPPEDREDPLAEWLTSVAEPMGVEFGEDLVTGHGTLDPLPALLALPTDANRIPIRFIPHNGPAVVPDWLRTPPERQRVCLTLGASNTESYGGDFVSIPDILAELADVDVEVVAALVPAQREQLKTLPDNVRVVESIALHTLLPTCSAIIHHGGFGSYGTALTLGVPQLIVSTLVSDHEFRGRELERHGAGVFLRTNRTTASEIKRNLVAILAEDSDYPRQAARLRDEALSNPSPNDVVTDLEKLVATHRR